ncbi:hypothetical protein BOX15_Mlig025610g1, partial [Macrostomum lignano]
VLVQLSDTQQPPPTWSVDAQPRWNVLFLKQLACQHFGLAPVDVEIALLTDTVSGSPLDDNASLTDCGIVENSRLELRSRRFNSDSCHSNESAAAARRLVPTLWLFCYDCEATRSAVVCAVCVNCGRSVSLSDSGGHVVGANEPRNWADLLDDRRADGGDCPYCGHQRCVRFEAACSAEGPHATRRCVPIRELSTNLDDGQSACCVCAELQPIGQPLLFFPCGHAVCLDCFKTDASARLSDGRLVFLADRGLTMDCPAHNCRSTNRYLGDAHAFRLLGAESYERVKLLGAQRALLTAEAGHVMCPLCSVQYELPASSEVQQVTCESGLGGCGAQICLSCRALAHAGSCVETNVESVVEDSNPERQSMSTIRRTSKPCPRCRAPTERNGGCMHMTCRLCCLSWCWICQLEWSEQCQTNHWFG